MDRNIHNKITKARKEHHCELCGGKIDKGEVYECETNVYEGEIYNFRVHLACMDLVDKLEMIDKSWEDGVSDAVFWELVRDEYKDRGLGDIDNETSETTLEKVKQSVL